MADASKLRPGTQPEIVLPPLHPFQREVLDSPVRFRVVVAGRRLGKSRLGMVEALRALFAGQLVWWVAPIRRQAQRVAYRPMRQMLAEPIRRGMVEPYDGELSLRCARSGGEVVFLSAEEPDNIRGEGPQLAILDEADFMAEEIWTNAVRPALTDSKGRALFLTTPNVEGGWLHRLFQRGQQDGRTYASWQRPSWGNPFLDPAEIEDARLGLPPITFRREYGAEFVSAAGARVERAWIRRGNPPPAERLRVSVGVDLAISESKQADYTAVVVLGVDRQDGAVWVLDAHRQRGGFHAAVELVKSVAGDHRPEVVAVEAVSYQKAAVEELLRTSRLPVRAMTPRGDKVARFAALEARYAQGLVTHAHAVPAAFDDEVLSFPVGGHDDFVDAASYAYEALGGGMSAGGGRTFLSSARRMPAARFRV